MISFTKWAGLFFKTLKRDEEREREKDEIKHQDPNIYICLCAIRTKTIHLPDNGAQQSGAGFIVEGDDHTRSWQVWLPLLMSATAHARTHTQLLLVSIYMYKSCIMGGKTIKCSSTRWLNVHNKSADILFRNRFAEWCAVDYFFQCPISAMAQKRLRLAKIGIGFH